MEILGDKKFVEVPGSKTHELPPLLVRMAPEVKRLDRVMQMAGELIEREEMLPFGHEAAQMDLALNLVNQYMGFVQHWQWGDSIMEWIRQCETTFGARIDLRNLLNVDLWPHADAPALLTLLEDKSVDGQGRSAIEKAVGLRLTFRQPPLLNDSRTTCLQWSLHSMSGIQRIKLGPDDLQTWLVLSASERLLLCYRRSTCRLGNRHKQTTFI